MVTGPIPRNPKATRPKAKTAGATMIPSSSEPDRRKAPPMRPTTVMPNQKAEKCPPRPRKDVQAGAALARGLDGLANVLGAGGGEDLDQLGDERPARVPQVMIVARRSHSPEPCPARTSQVDR